MTREEAATIIKETIEIKDDQRLEALMMAIDSLRAWDIVIQKIKDGDYDPFEAGIGLDIALDIIKDHVPGEG